MRVCAKILITTNGFVRPGETVEQKEICECAARRGKNIYQHPTKKRDQKNDQNMTISLGRKREETFIVRDVVRLSAHCERSGYGDNQYPVGTLWQNQDRHACVTFVGGSWRSW